MLGIFNNIGRGIIEKIGIQFAQVRLRPTLCVLLASDTGLCELNCVKSL